MSARARPAALPILLVVLLVALPAGSGCGILPTNDDSASDRLCTPGSYVFCRCPDRSEGTKLCRPDGQSFDPCISATGACGGLVASAASPPPDAEAELPSLRSAADPAAGCSGAEVLVPVAAAAALRLDGDTTTATGDRRGVAAGCVAGAGAGASDDVRRIAPEVSGALSVAVEGDGALHPVVHLRSGCDDAASEIACGVATGPDEASQARLTAMVAAGKPYFLFVEGQGGTMGHYDVTLTLTPARFCGDGRVDPPEACDDGNAADGDGCAADCGSVDGNPASAGACTGQPVDVWPGRVVEGKGTTLGYGRVWNVPADRCGPMTDPGSPTNDGDHVYAVTAHATGALTVHVEPAAALVVGAACAGPDATTTCGSGTATDLEIPASAGRPVWIAVRGAGPYAIAFAVVADGGL